MDTISSFGGDLLKTITPTYKLLGDILNQPENARAIRATKRETISYGSHERHVLDLYTPSASAVNPAGGGPRPIFIFVYGGGFRAGERVIPAVDGGLVYTNVGSFMADKLGYETIIMDYTLTQHGATYPSGGDEIEMVVKWLEKRNTGSTQRDVYIMGNSAGGAHVLTWLLEAAYEETIKRLTAGQGALKLKAAAVVGCPCRWYFQDLNDEFLRTALLDYYTDAKKVDENEPTRVAERFIDRKKGKFSWPPILVVVSEFDPEYMIKSGKEFEKMWTAAGGQADYWVLEGHNHLSPVLCMGTGGEREEAWAHEMMRRMQS